MKKGGRFPVRSLAVLLAILGGIVWAVRWRAESRLPRVKAEPVRAAPLDIEWSATGYVESRSAGISSPEPARVERIHVREGDRVRTGQPLLLLSSLPQQAAVRTETEGYRAALALADGADAALREARHTYDARLRRTRAELSAARSRWRQAVETLDRSRASIDAQIATARERVASARAVLDDLEMGPRAEEVVAARAELDAAEAMERRSRLERERQERLYRDGATSREAVDAAREAGARAEAARKGRRAALSLVEQGPRPERIAAARAEWRASVKMVDQLRIEREGLRVEERRIEEALAGRRAAEAALAEVEGSRLQIERLRREAAAARARANQARETVGAARTVLRERVLKAPFAGTVSRRQADPGDVAAPSVPLLTVIESDRIWVTAEVDEQDLAPLRVGGSVEITSAAFADQTFRGTVERIGSEAIPQTEIRTGARIKRVRIDLKPTPPSKRRLQPGMEVYVTSRTRMKSRSLLIPSDAIIEEAGGQYVFTLDEGRSRRRGIRTGYRTGRDTEVMSGLSEGDRVIVTGKEGLADGAAVHLIEPE